MFVTKKSLYLYESCIFNETQSHFIPFKVHPNLNLVFLNIYIYYYFNFNVIN